ncbi:MAG: hypothetical protein HN352_01465 [Bacteroidetes bacterium]|jgi:curli biogenesis system outer membrane secretion channel CsgG|nr:hypothetical protein [Bacteroidota bacterium]MBT4409619.1 hypothetical protein [Bacteroidota bacterium]MBT7091908.1 hypothetical protein [Bacteroidota bacterium]MBT7463038.1 hypothetical protein [Bacteroidota bacterium]
MKVLKTSLLVVILLSLYLNLKAQENSIQGYIIALGEDKVTLDLKKGQVTKGDLVKVITPGEVIIHPVTGEKIQKKDEIISNITITEVADSYSVGEAYPIESFSLLKVGMKVFTMEASEISESMIKKFIVIPPMNIVGGPKGMLGSYMGDLLTEELFKLDRFRILDRETFDLQQFELGLKNNGSESKTTGVDYLIVGSAFPPDVVVKSTGIPLKAIATAATGGQGAMIVKNLVPDLKVKELEALVKFTLKIIDVSTGEVIFICSEMAKAEGKNQINLESGVLGGVTLNGGATDFKNTITGKASQLALLNAAQYLADYFEGKIKTKNFQGTVIELKKSKKKDRGENLAIMDIRQGTDGAPVAVIGGGSDEGVVKGHSFLITLPKETVSSITGKSKVTGISRVGLLKIQSVEFDAALADLNGVVLGRDIQNNIIYKGRLMHYTPFRLTSGINIYGVWSDALIHLDLGLEYYPNFKNADWINHVLWLGLRGQFGLIGYNDSDGNMLFANNFSGEFLLGVNPMRKSFDYKGFDPYFGIKYKLINSDLAGGGPEVFMGADMGGLFFEVAVGWGAHSDIEAMSDPTWSHEITGWGFNRIGALIGYRIPLNKLAL